MLNRLQNFMIDYAGLVVVAIILAGAITLGFMLVSLGNYEAEQKATFMQDCTLDLKLYECTALWRSGEKTTNMVTVVR